SNVACNSLLRLSIAGSGEASFGPEGTRSQRQFQAGATLHFNWGSHSFAVGGDFRRLDPARHDVGTTFTIAADAVNNLIQGNDLWSSTLPQQDLSGVLNEASLFAEDTWRIGKRLTATFGLRWEISPGPTPSQAANFVDPATNDIVSLQRPL